MIYRRDYHSPSIKKMLLHGLKPGDRLYSFGIGMLTYAIFVRQVSDEYVELQFPKEERTFRAPIHDDRWDMTDTGAIVSAYNHWQRVMRDGAIEIRALDKLIKKKQIVIN